MVGFIQFLIGALFLGGMYCLIALGITSIYKSTKVFNFAQGWMATTGALLLVTFMNHFGVVGGLVAALAFGALVGLGIDRLLMRRMIGQPLIAALLMTIMLAHVFEGANILAWGTFGYELPITLPGQPIILGELVIRHELLWGIGIAVLTFVGLKFFYERTLLGTAMRATAEDHQVAQSLGIPVRLIFTLNWVIAGILAVIAGLFLGVVCGVHYIMYTALMGGIVVALLGGLDSIDGALYGGLILGFLEALARGYLHPVLGDIMPYIVMLLVLLVKPYGLFGLVRVERL